MATKTRRRVTRRMVNQHRKQGGEMRIVLRQPFKEDLESLIEDTMVFTAGKGLDTTKVIQRPTKDVDGGWVATIECHNSILSWIKGKLRPSRELDIESGELVATGERYAEEDAEREREKEEGKARRKKEREEAERKGEAFKARFTESRKTQAAESRLQKLLDKGATYEEIGEVEGGLPGSESVKSLERTLQIRGGREKEERELAGEGVETLEAREVTRRVETGRTEQGKPIYKYVTTKEKETPAEALARVRRGRREALQEKRALRKEKYRPYLKAAEGVRDIAKYVAGETARGTAHAAVRVTRGTKVGRISPRPKPTAPSPTGIAAPGIDLSALRGGFGSQLRGGGDGLGGLRMGLGMGMGPGLHTSPMSKELLVIKAVRTNGETDIPNTSVGIADEAGIPERDALTELRRLTKAGALEKIGSGKDAIWKMRKR